MSMHHQEQAYYENFVMGSDAAEFVNKVKDQVRNRQKRMSNVEESGDEHSRIWGMFMATTLNAATFMGKNFSTIQSVVKNYESLTLKQMFDVTAQLVNNQEEINCLDKILWGNFLGHICNDIFCDRKGNKDECLKNAESVKTFAKRFGIGQWSFIGPGSEKKWYPSENSPQGEWDHVAEEMLLKFAESGHPIFRSTTPLSRGKLTSKGKGKVSIHFSADQDTVDTIYRIILSVNQLSIYGAVAAVCDEYEGHQDSTGQPVILVGQSTVLGEIKAEVLAHDEEPRDDQIILQQYVQQVESLSPEHKLSNF